MEWGKRTLQLRRHTLAGDAESPSEPVVDEVAVEAPLEIRLGSRGSTVLMRTPGNDEELVRGFLYSEGMITGLEDLLALERPDHLVGDEVGNVIRAELRPGSGALLDRAFYGSSSCGVCGKNTISQLAVRAERITGRLKVAPGLIASLPERLLAAQPAFARTGGLHASALFDAEGQLLAVREDVGRHNALDKLIGWALGAGRLPASETVLLVSGRTSYEIVQKSLAAGIPVVAAIGAPTSLAVALAEEHDLTLIGFLREGRMNVYAGLERVDVR